MNQSQPYHGKKNLLALCSAAVCAFLLGTQAQAFDGLNEVQTLIFDKPHLKNTKDGQSISYSYRSEIDEEEPVDDLVTLNITAQIDDERRDVVIDFLSDERHLNMPPFSGYRGNPVIMAMLEHVVQKIGQDTGGGALYFRNRIRDAIASDKVTLEKQKLSVNDNEIDAAIVQFQPFEKDSRLDPASIYKKAVFTITLSDTVPGGIVGVGVKAEADGHAAFSRQLMFVK